MIKYSELSPPALSAVLEKLREEYKSAQARKLQLDMSRGKPGASQLDLADSLLSAMSAAECFAQNGADSRNYGVLEGIPEARQLMGALLEINPDNVFVGGNSSLSLMHDCISFAYIHGVPGSDVPWGKLDSVKILCPSPGYDRHFAMTGHFGFELVTVPMKSDGPDMDVVDELVKDHSVKAIWCVPKYSNPQGITYSDAVVRRFASLSPAAKDFRVLWDNAYSVHDLDTRRPDTLLNLMDELIKNGSEDMALLFASTSKITYSGAGIAAIGCSKTNLDWLKKHVFYQTIGYDKLNQLRHVRMFPDIESVKRHMEKHAEILRPKFETVLSALAGLGEEGLASWETPRGGYFISVDVMAGCARRVVSLCEEAGVILTGAGATFPYGNDPKDENIRIAPTFPPIGELEEAIKLFCLCVRIACVEKLIGE